MGACLPKINTHLYVYSFSQTPTYNTNHIWVHIYACLLKLETVSLCIPILHNPT